MKKLIALLLLSIMLIGVFCGCGDEKKGQDSVSEFTPPTKEAFINEFKEHYTFSEVAKPDSREHYFKLSDKTFVQMFLNGNNRVSEFFYDKSDYGNITHLEIRDIDTKPIQLYYTMLTGKTISHEDIISRFNGVSADKDGYKETTINGMRVRIKIDTATIYDIPKRETATSCVWVYSN